MLFRNIVNGAKRAALSRNIRENADPVSQKTDLNGAFQKIAFSITGKLLPQY